MKKQGSLTVQRICVFAGVGLLLVALITLAVWQYSVNTALKKSQNYVQLLQELMPQSQNAALEERRDNTMSSLSIEGIDFVGVIDIPRYSSTLPVCADWGETSKYPCRFDGSIYNRTLQIGATSQKGQYDFYREISVGDKVYFTDMEGNRYALEVIDLKYEKHIDQTALRRTDSAMTLFIKNLYDFEYLVVYCDVVS